QRSFDCIGCPCDRTSIRCALFGNRFVDGHARPLAQTHVRFAKRVFEPLRTEAVHRKHLRVNLAFVQLAGDTVRKTELFEPRKQIVPRVGKARFGYYERVVKIDEHERHVHRSACRAERSEVQTRGSSEPITHAEKPRSLCWLMRSN